MFALLLAAQAAAPAPPAPPRATAFSILEPVANEPCVRRDARDVVRPDDIVVCGRPLPSQTLPYPEEIVPDGPQPSNPDLRATGGGPAPCASDPRGCTGVGLPFLSGGTTIVRFVQKVVAPSSCCERPGEGNDPGLLAADMVHAVKRAFRRKPDRSQRVTIALDAPPPSSEGRVLP